MITKKKVAGEFLIFIFFSKTPSIPKAPAAAATLLSKCLARQDSILYMVFT